MAHRTPLLTYHAHPALESPAHAADSDLLQLADLLRIVQVAWRHKLLIVLGMALGAGLGWLYYTQATPVYRSTAQVLVVKKRGNVLSDHERGGFYRDDVGTHVPLIESPTFVRETVEQWKLAALPSMKQYSDPTHAIVTSLVVSRDTDDPVAGSSSILSFALRGTHPQDCRVVLDALIANYQQFLAETSRSINEEALEVITGKAEDVRRELERKETEYQEFRKRAPLMWERGSGQLRDHMTEIEAKRSALSIRGAELTEKLAAVRAARAEDPERAALLMIETDKGAAARLSIEERLLPLLLRESQLLEDYGPAHPEVLSVRDEIELTRELFGQPSTARSRLLNGSRTGDAATLYERIDAYIQSLQRELNEIRTSEQAMAALAEKEQDRVRKLANFEFEDRQFSADIARIQQFHDSLIRQIQEVNLSKDLLGYSTQTIAPPRDGVQVEPRLVLAFAVPILFGMTFGFGLGYLVEVTDKRFRDLDEVRRRLGSPVVGHIPSLTRTGGSPRRLTGPAADPTLCDWFVANSPAAEAYRGVRTALYFSTHGEGNKVIQITSPNPGDGKTTLAANLAVSIAQSGKSILLIDADLRRPRLHSVFGLSARIGLGSVIIGDAELPEAIQPTAIPRLSVLPAGPLPPNPAELLTLPRFEDLLSYLREQYDFVLIDTPALLSVTDPSVVAPRVDGVLLAIRLTKNGRPDAERARELLESIGTRLIGVVINGTDRRTKPVYAADRPPGETPPLSPARTELVTGGPPAVIEPLEHSHV